MRESETMKTIWYLFVGELGALATDIAIWLEDRSVNFYNLGGRVEMWADRKLYPDTQD